MLPMTETESIELLKTLEAHEPELPCDLGIRQDDTCPNPAKWIMFRKPCCEVTSTPALACDSCKETRLMNRIGVVCRGCNTLHPDASAAYARIELIRQ